jgi:hypothetical protein
MTALAPRQKTSAERNVGASPTGAAPRRKRAIAWLLLIGALLGLGGMIVVSIFWPRAAAGGWLAGFGFVSSAVIGSVFALLIHALTGGRWLSAFGDVFVAAAAAMSGLTLLFIPVLGLLPQFYPWVDQPDLTPNDVRSIYLNTPFFIGRSVAALCFWSILGLLTPRLEGGARVLAGAVGLTVHAFVIGLIGVDWILSLQPEFWSSSFGATLAFTQFAAALAWVALVAGGERDAGGLRDLAGMLLATLLGLTYLNFISFLVIWYGNVPDRVFWFSFRDRWPWSLIAGLAFVFGSVAPILLLFFERIRSSRLAMRFVGAITLIGIGFYYAYLIVPPFGAASLGAALLSTLAIGLLFGAITLAPWRRRRASSQ